MKRGDDAILDVGTTGDTTAAQAQLDSFIEKWKTEGVERVVPVGRPRLDEAVRPEDQEGSSPTCCCWPTTHDVLDQAQQEQQSEHRSRTRTTGIITAGGLSPQEYDASANWKYCADIYQDATGKVPENADADIKTSDGKIDDTYGTINDACQTLTMFHDIGERVGQYLNNTNWVYTVDHFGPIDEPGLGPVLVAARGQVLRRRQLAAPGVRLDARPDGLWKPITPLEDITG